MPNLSVSVSTTQTTAPTGSVSELRGNINNLRGLLSNAISAQQPPQTGADAGQLPPSQARLADLAILERPDASYNADHIEAFREFANNFSFGNSPFPSDLAEVLDDAESALQRIPPFITESTQYQEGRQIIESAFQQDFAALSEREEAIGSQIDALFSEQRYLREEASDALRSADGAEQHGYDDTADDLRARASDLTARADGLESQRNDLFRELEVVADEEGQLHADFTEQVIAFAVDIALPQLLAERNGEGANNTAIDRTILSPQYGVDPYEIESPNPPSQDPVVGPAPQPAQSDEQAAIEAAYGPVYVDEQEPSPSSNIPPDVAAFWELTSATTGANIATPEDALAAIPQVVQDLSAFQNGLADIQSGLDTQLRNYNTTITDSTAEREVFVEIAASARSDAEEALRSADGAEQHGYDDTADDLREQAAGHIHRAELAEQRITDLTTVIGYVNETTEGALADAAQDIITLARELVPEVGEHADMSYDEPSDGGSTDEAEGAPIENIGPVLPPEIAAFRELENFGGDVRFLGIHTSEQAIASVPAYISDTPEFSEGVDELISQNQSQIDALNTETEGDTGTLEQLTEEATLLRDEASDLNDQADGAEQHGYDSTADDLRNEASRLLRVASERETEASVIEERIQEREQEIADIEAAQINQIIELASQISDSRSRFSDNDAEQPQAEGDAMISPVDAPQYNVGPRQPAPDVSDLDDALETRASLVEEAASLRGQANELRGVAEDAEENGYDDEAEASLVEAADLESDADALDVRIAALDNEIQDNRGDYD